MALMNSPLLYVGVLLEVQTYFGLEDGTAGLLHTGRSKGDPNGLLVCAPLGAPVYQQVPSLSAAGSEPCDKGMSRCFPLYSRLEGNAVVIQ